MAPVIIQGECKVGRFPKRQKQRYGMRNVAKTFLVTYHCITQHRLVRCIANFIHVMLVVILPLVLGHPLRASIILRLADDRRTRISSISPREFRCVTPFIIPITDTVRKREIADLLAECT